MSDIEITLTTPTYGGESMGRLDDGRAVFVPFALPGETVRAHLVEEKRGFARASLLEVLTPSPQRIAAKCLHFGVCGGCHYQMLPYPEQLKVKETVLRDQLARIGKIEAPPVMPVVPAPEPWNYRNHMQFHVTADGRLGFVAAGNRRSVFAISECHLPEPALNAMWPQLELDAETPVERVSLRAGDELILVLESQTPEPPEMQIEAGISVVHLSEEDAVVLAGSDYIVMQVLDRPFRVSAGSFFQVNTAMAARMVEHLIRELRVVPSMTLLDVYCGVGLFSAFFAPIVRKLIGIEISASACDDFTTNLDEFDNVELYEAPAEAVIAGIGTHPDVVIVDPPRAGLEKEVLDGLVALGPKMLAYVSCDPSTLARDAARLIAGGYTLTKVTPFDLFPQTYHIESISIFERGE
jgi:23S rRNA (uracil1939-C5)-methyltransferase